MGVRPLKLYRSALELMVRAEGVITPGYLAERAHLSKRQSRNALLLGMRKHLIERTGYGQYRRSAQPAGAV